MSVHRRRTKLKSEGGRRKAEGETVFDFCIDLSVFICVYLRLIVLGFPFHVSRFTAFESSGTTSAGARTRPCAARRPSSDILRSVLPSMSSSFASS